MAISPTVLEEHFNKNADELEAVIDEGINLAKASATPIPEPLLINLKLSGKDINDEVKTILVNKYTKAGWEAVDWKGVEIERGKYSLHIQLYRKPKPTRNYSEFERY